MANEKRVGENTTTHVPVTYERCEHTEGPFFHGTKSALVAGDELVPGYGSNFQQGRVSSNIYFTALVDTAAWGRNWRQRLPERGAGTHLRCGAPGTVRRRP